MTRLLSGHPEMMLDVTRFFTGFSGAVGTLFLLISFSIYYWLLGTESCDSEVTTLVRETGLLHYSNGPKSCAPGGTLLLNLFSILLTYFRLWPKALDD